MSSTRSYKIDVPEKQLDLLKRKLELASFPDEIDDAGWTYGSPLSDVKRLTEYWKNEFDWRKQEREINKMPQYMTSIKPDSFEPLDIHFVHQRSEVKGAIPLLFVHGWPGSFIEVSKILPLLTKGDKDQPAFHVVAPSIPRFGFSEGPTDKSWSVHNYAEVFQKLMESLGYNEYVTQGGDLGYYITRLMGINYPDSCKGTHINFFPMLGPPSLSKYPALALKHAITPYSEAEKQRLARMQWFLRDGHGYASEHSTKPQTIGYSLRDSPVGLLAWIYEKLHDWTDSYPWTDDEILTWVSIYNFSAAGPAATVRIYYETTYEVPNPTEQALSYNGKVPLGISIFPKEILAGPKLWTHTMGPVVSLNEHDKGGHFAAWERPEDLVEDLRKMFGKGGGAHGVVKGKSGY
ncbi:MAG: hypothetical protein M1833_005337 [Piccolia ochrophora]|nr:MAG: hypothetical protein M1833_005337 [Piccolia ochrophora]